MHRFKNVILPVGQTKRPSSPTCRHGWAPSVKSTTTSVVDKTLWKFQGKKKRSSRTQHDRLVGAVRSVQESLLRCQSEIGNSCFKASGWSELNIGVLEKHIPAWWDPEHAEILAVVSCVVVSSCTCWLLVWDTCCCNFINLQWLHICCRDQIL